MATTQSIIITNPDGVAFTLHGVPNGATLQLLPTEPTVPTVAEPTVAEPTPTPTVDEVDEVDATEPTPKTTVGPKGLNRADRKRTQSKPQSKSGPIKGKGKDPITSTAPRTPAQQAGNAKGRFTKYGSLKTATDWLALCEATEDADRIKDCKATLKANGFKVSKAGKVSQA